MEEIALTTPSFSGVSFELLDRTGSVQWPGNAGYPDRYADHVGGFVRGMGHLVPTPCVPTREQTSHR